MKILFLSLLFPLLAKSQSENDALRLVQSKNQIIVLNKQSCTVSVIIQIDNDKDTVVNIEGGKTYTFIVTLEDDVVRARPQDRCPDYRGGLGQVQLTVTKGALPIKWKSFNVKVLRKNVYQVEFEADEVIDIREFRIQANFDNTGWVDVLITKPDPIQPNKKYTYIIDRSKQ